MIRWCPSAEHYERLGTNCPRSEYLNLSGTPRSGGRLKSDVAVTAGQLRVVGAEVSVGQSILCDLVTYALVLRSSSCEPSPGVPEAEVVMRTWSVCLVTWAVLRSTGPPVVVMPLPS